MASSTLDDTYVDYDENVQVPTLLQLKEQNIFDDEDSDAASSSIPMSLDSQSPLLREKCKTRRPDQLAVADIEEGFGGGGDAWKQPASTCRICHKFPRDRSKLDDVLVPCRCRGWVHRKCLDAGRSASPAAFSACSQCGFIYRLKKPQEIPFCTQLYFYVRVVFDLSVILLGMQLVFVAFAMLLRALFPTGLHLFSLLNSSSSSPSSSASPSSANSTLTVGGTGTNSTVEMSVAGVGGAAAMEATGLPPSFLYFYTMAVFLSFALFGLIKLCRDQSCQECTTLCDGCCGGGGNNNNNCCNCPGGRVGGSGLSGGGRACSSGGECILILLLIALIALAIFGLIAGVALGFRLVRGILERHIGTLQRQRDALRFVVADIAKVEFQRKLFLGTILPTLPTDITGLILSYAY